MVIKPFSHLARQSFGKTFTHGYAQSVVAATQSSYASTTTPFVPFGPHNSSRFSRPSSAQVHASFHHVANSTNSANKPTGSSSQNIDGHDGSLTAYYEAWQKHQQIHDGDAKEWRQFQFQKRVGWKQPAAVALDVTTKDRNDAVTSNDRTASPTLERSYSTSAVDDIKKVEDVVAKARDDLMVDEVAVDDTNAGDIIVSHGSLGKSDGNALAQGLRSDSKTPTTSSVLSHNSTLQDSPQTSIGEITASPSALNREAEGLFGHIEELHRSQSFNQIPAVFESLLNAGIKPTAPAYNALLAAAIHSSKISHHAITKALDVYADMLRRRVSPDTAFYTELLGLLSTRALDVSGQKDLLQEKQLRFGGLNNGKGFFFGSHETENAILSEDDALANAVRIFRSSALEQGRAFSADTYNLLITACAKNGVVDEMIQIYTHMESQGVKPMGTMFAPMIEAFAKSGDLGGAVECYNEYKTLAMEDDKSSSSPIDRRDNEVYAAVVKAYAICGKIEGGNRFASRIIDSYANVTQNRKERLESVQDTITVDALLQDKLIAKDFPGALKLAEERNLTLDARSRAMASVCVAAADHSDLDSALKASQYLPATNPYSTKAILALLALQVRLGNDVAASGLWNTAKTVASQDASSVETVTFYLTDLVRNGRADEALFEAREVFDRIRASVGKQTAKFEVTDQIDEAIDKIATVLAEIQIQPSPNASMDLLWAMVENGGLMSVSAEKLLASLGPDEIITLNWQNRMLALQVEAGLIGNAEARLDIAHAARFAHLLELSMMEGIPLDERSESLIERAIAVLPNQLSELSTKWRNYKQLRDQPPPQRSFSSPPNTAISSGSYSDTYDPYGATTDHKGSAAIVEELESRKHNGGLNEALIRFRNIRRAGRHPRAIAYAKLIIAAAKEGRINLTHDIVGMAKTDIPYISGHTAVHHGWVSILDAMVGACLSTGRRAVAERFHQEMLDMGAAPTANTYGLYITTLKESTKTFDEATEAVTIFNRALSEGVAPSSFLYNALIGKLGKARRIDDCLRYFQEMRNAGIRPTSVTYGTIVNALCRVSDERFAEELFDEMESMPNYKPRPAPYNSLMQFFLVTKRDGQKVLAYFERMKSRKIEPTMHTYKLLVDTYATLDPIDLKAAEGVLDTIRSTGQRPEAVHYASLIHAKGCVLHDMEGARAVFDQALSSQEFRPHACLYQALFESMVANHCVSQTEAVLDSMSANRVEMTAYIANTLIHGWATENKIAKSRVIFDSVGVEKREPSTYEAMTRAFLTAEDRDGALAVVQEMLSRGYPSAVSNKVLELVGHGGKPTSSMSADSAN